MRKIDVNKGRKEIVDSQCPMCFIEIREIKKGYNNRFDRDKIIVDPLCIFGIGTFSRESIREKLSNFITNRQSLKLFDVSKLRFGFRMYGLKKVPTLINKSE